MKPVEKLVGIVCAAVIAAALLPVMCSGPGPTPLPPKVQTVVDRHREASAVDTAVVHRLEADTARAANAQRRAAASQRQAELRANEASRRADSLAAVAAAAQTAHDSAEAYREAYSARTGEVDTLKSELAQAGVQLQAAAARQAATDTIAVVWKTHALRGDSVIAQLLPLAQHRDDCRILGLVRCPSRKQALVGGSVAGAMLAAVLIGAAK